MTNKSFFNEKSGEPNAAYLLVFSKILCVRTYHDL